MEGPAGTTACRSMDDNENNGWSDLEWNALDWGEAEDKEEETLSIRGFSDAYSDAMDPGQHAINVEGLLSYLGVQLDDTSISWEAVLLELFHLDESLKKRILDFSAHSTIRESPYPEEADYDMPPRGVTQWQSQDQAINQEWQIFMNDVVDLSEGNLIGNTMTKPTGRWDAPLTMIWNYPSWSSPIISWGQALDRSNPCVGMQYSKLGPSTFIRTQNRLPIRANYKSGRVPWEHLFERWSEIEGKCLTFCRWLNSKSRVILLIGKENVTAPRDRIFEMDNEMEHITIPLCPSVKIQLFGQTPQLEIICNRTTKEIRHLILSSYHTQAFLDDIPFSIRAYHDIIWNGVCGLVGIPVPRPRYFLRHGSWFRRKEDDRRKWTPLKRAVTLRACEKKTGVILSEHAVRWAFESTLERNTSFIMTKDTNGSYVGSILRMFISKAWEKESTGIWRTSPQAAKMFDTSLNLHKPSSTEKRLATIRSEAWKSSPARQRRDEGLRKGREGPRKFHAWAARLDALFRTKQVRDRLTADPSELALYQCRSRERLLSLPQDTTKRQKDYLKNHVIWWSTNYKKGLRYRGDGCVDQDNFPYNDEEHPAVKLHGNWKQRERANLK